MASYLDSSGVIFTDSYTTFSLPAYGTATIFMGADARLPDIYDGSIIIQKVQSSDNGYGYNADTDTFVDLMKAGIVDPVKVTRTALQNAASIAALVLTTESAVVEKPEEEEPAAAAGGHGHAH